MNLIATDKTVVIRTKTEARKYLSEGNTKLDKSIAIWNLPATMEVCGRICKGCFAVKAQVMYPNCLPSREDKFAFSKTEAFVPTVIGSIAKLQSEYVRIHESGEFYSQEYIDKWYAIAKALPNVMFLAYSKRHSEFDFSGLRSLPNVIVINSLFGKKLNYGKLDRKPTKAVLCPSMDKNGIGCRKGCDVCYNLANKAKLESDGIFFKAH